MSRNAPQLPNNSGTPNATTVFTSTGFTAGDPVYYSNGDYKKPSNLPLPSAISFPFTENAAINPYLGGGIIAPSFTFAQMQTGLAGGTQAKFAAILTNGNIVQVWTNYTVATVNPSCVYFRVVDTSGVVVVSPTVVSTVYTTGSGGASVGVVALTGGGFAVGWLNGAGGLTNRVNYAIYSNTGSVVTAATQDTSLDAAASYQPIQMVGLANGGFVVAIKSTTGAISFRGYGATGTAAYVTQSTGITSNAAAPAFALTARSDSSVFICDMFSTTSYKYAIFNSSGTAIVAATTFTTAYTVNAINFGGCSASVQTDGTTIVIAFYAQTNTGYSYPAFRFLPASNTLGSEIAGIPAANLFYNTTYAGSYISVLCLSSNNFIIVFSDANGNMQYAVYNSSGTCVSGSNTTGALPQQINGGYCAPSTALTLLEFGGSVYAYWSVAAVSQKPVQQVYCKINTTTYALTTFSSTSVTAYTATGQTPNALVASTLSPTSASYTTATSSSSVVTNTPATVVSQTRVSTAACDAVASCTLPNGQFVVAFRVASSRTVYASVYSSSGAFIQTITVGQGYAGSITYSVKIAALSGGGFVVGYTGTALTDINLTVYNSSFAVVSSVVAAGVASFSIANNFDMASLPNNLFVVSYIYGGSTSYTSVYNTAGTQLTYFQQTLLSQGISVGTTSWGEICVSGFYQGGGQGRTHVFVPTGSNVWTETVIVTQSGYAGFVQNPQLVSTQSGLHIACGSSTYPNYWMFTAAGSAAISYTATTSSWPLGTPTNPNTASISGIGTTGNGQVVMLNAYGSTNLGVASVPAQMTWSTGQPISYSITGSANVPMFSKNAYTLPTATNGGSTQPRVTPGVGSNAVVTCLDGSGYASFLIVTGDCNSKIYNIVANTTVSSLLPIAPTPNVTTVANGLLAGIAATTATAGSTGQLITNGQVQLGSSYTNTATGAFDYTGQAVAGVKGTFNGPNINLQGN